MLSKYSQRHSYHLVDPSIMPFLTSVSCLSLTIGGVLYFHGHIFGMQTLIFGLFCRNKARDIADIPPPKIVIFLSFL